MHFIRPLASLLLFASLAAVATAHERDAVDYTDSGTSSVSVSKNAQGQVIDTITTTRFDVVRLFDSAQWTPILVRKTTQETINESVDGSLGKLQVEARVTKTKTYDQVLWTLKEDAHDATYFDDGLFLTWQFGCCDSATGYRAYNVHTGKLVMAYDDRTGTPEGAVTSPFVIDVPNAKPVLQRFIGILTASSTRDFVPAKTSDGLSKIATIAYGGLDGTVAKYDLYVKVPSDVGVSLESSIIDTTGQSKNQIQGNRVELWTSDGVSDPVKAMQGISVQVKVSMQNDQTLTIPIASDRVDLTRAQLPAGFRLIPATR